MKTIKDSTITTGRLEQSIEHAVNRVAGPQITQQISNAVEDERLRTGRVTKFYHYLDKAEVKIDHSGELVLCKILHRFGGDVLDLYTPVASEESFCDELKEPCIIPRHGLNCLVIKIHDEDSEENLILGYYENEEIVGLNPAAPGNFKIATRGGTNQYWIKFGHDGLELRLPENGSMDIGEIPDEMENKEYADSTNVYTKEEVYNKTEVYTKEEVDELIAQKLAELGVGESVTS